MEFLILMDMIIK